MRSESPKLFFKHEARDANRKGFLFGFLTSLGSWRGQSKFLNLCVFFVMNSFPHIERLMLFKEKRVLSAQNLCFPWLLPLRTLPVLPHVRLVFVPLRRQADDSLCMFSEKQPAVLHTLQQNSKKVSAHEK